MALKALLCNVIKHKGRPAEKKSKGVNFGDPPCAVFPTSLIILPA